ncbi:glutamate racemase [Sphingorhabdus arenilitoris]
MSLPLTASQNPDPAAPILIFDSGVGGLSVLKEVTRALPLAPIVYAADHAGLPYGEKSEAEIAARVPALLGRLVERYNPRLVTIACNTACTIALSHVRAALNLPVVGTVPAIKPAAIATKSGVIGLLGTQATIRQAYVDQLEREFAANLTLLRYAAPELVHAAEAKMRGDAISDDVYVSAINGLRNQPNGSQMDVVILGCTHFPLLIDELAKVAGNVSFVDGAKGIARRISHLCDGQSWPENRPLYQFVTTGDPEMCASYLPQLIEFGFRQIDGL